MKGPSLARRLLIVGGYVAFFVFALAVFIYLTLPLDTVRAYLVRKAADEYGADLVIEDLSTWGLSGLHAENVSLTFRPTPEEEAAMETAREARKAWEAAHGGDKKADPAAKTAETGAEDDTAGETGAAGSKKVAKRTPEPADEGDVAGLAAKLEKGGDEKSEDKAGAAPPLPMGPRPITIESFKAKIGLMALLRGAKAGAVEASIAGGSLEAVLDNDPEGYHLTGKWDAIDLRQLAFLRRKLDLPIAGTFGGDVDVQVPTADAGKLKLPNATGHVALKVADASLGPGKLATFEVPLARITGIDGKLVLDKKKATIEHFDITGKELEGELTGYIDLKDSLARFGPRLHLRFKLGDEFLEAHKDLKVLLTSMPKIKAATSEGYTGLMVNGTFADPKFVPRKDSPYKAGSVGPKASPGDARKKERDAAKDRKAARPGKGLTGGGSTATTGTAKALPPTVPTGSTEPRIEPPAPATEAAPEPEPVVEAPTEPAEDNEAPAPVEPEPAVAPEVPAEAVAPEGGEGTENPEAPAEHTGEAPAEE